MGDYIGLYLGVTAFTGMIFHFIIELEYDYDISKFNTFAKVVIPILSTGWIPIALCVYLCLNLSSFMWKVLFLRKEK